MFTDAFDNPILLGGFYGTALGTGGSSALVIGEAVRFTEKGVSLRITQRRNHTGTGMKDIELGRYKDEKKVVSYHPGQLFPVAPSIQLMQRVHRVLACASLVQIGDGEATFTDFNEFMNRTHSKKD